MTPVGIPDATPNPSGARGLLTAADKTKLDAMTGTATGTNTGDLTLTAVGSSPSANGASLAGQALTLQPADATRPGVVSIAAQIFAGLKTFQNGIGHALGGASDIALKVGTSMADGSVADGSKLFSARAGLGGTEVEYFSIMKPVGTGPGVVNINAPYANNVLGINITGCGNGWGGIHWNPGNGGRVVFGAYNAPAGVECENRGLYFYQNSNAYEASALMRWTVGTAVGGVASSVPVFDFAAPANIQSTQRALRVKIGTIEKFAVLDDGSALIAGTFSLGSDGAARPSADAAHRGTAWYSKSAGGAADTLEVCLKSAADTYSWKVISTG